MTNSLLKTRAFVAIDLDQPTREYLGEISSRLQASRADVGWVKPSNAHLTLKFLGDISRETQLSIENALRDIFKNQKPFELCLSGIGVFPSLERPRIVWVGIQDESASLASMFNTLEAVFESLGVPREKRGFSPHLTLGRVRSNSGKSALSKAIMDDRDSVGPCLHVNHAILFKSDLKPSGSVYTPLCKFQFGAL